MNGKMPFEYSHRVFILFPGRDQYYSRFFVGLLFRIGCFCGFVVPDIFEYSIFFLGETSTIVGCFVCLLPQRAPEGSTGMLIFVVLFGEARIEPAIPSFQGE